MSKRGFRWAGIQLTAGLIVLSWGPGIARAQQRPDPRDDDRASQTWRDYNVSELAKENNDRVAASAPQIQAILVTDPGLVVELKRVVAKEATENGQVVDDAALTDTAIFDRLNRDVKFRAVATSLLQRYGYLLPILNPLSEAGKQQDILIKERTRRLVQAEDRESVESVISPKQAVEAAGASGCDPAKNDLRCLGRPANVAPSKPAQPNPLPGLDQTTPSLPDLLQNAQNEQILRVALGQSEAPRQINSGSDTGSSGDSRVRTVGDTSSMSTQSAMLLGSGGSAANRGTGSDFDLLGAIADFTDPAALVADNFAPRANLARAPLEKDVSPVTMVHRANPYYDVPSLFDMYVQASPRDKQTERFGLKVFHNEGLSPAAIPMDLPVGPDYVVGPGDALTVNMWGGMSQRTVRVVDRQGRLNLPEVGPLLVSGHNLGNVQQTVQDLLRTQYRGVSADVSLTRLRTVRVYVVGEVVEPGAYDISSLSTPLNALYAAGGITARGSLRSLKHYRGKQLVEQVDAYNLLLNGVQGDMAHIENGDTILVPPVGPQVTIDGMVRRPAIFELRSETNLGEAIDLAGGILPAAALKHIEVQRLEAHEKRTMLSLDISQASDDSSIAKQLAGFKVQDGDQVHIFPIAPYNESAIYLQGHVVRPGRYSYHDGMKLTEVINSYSDLLPEPAGHYAEIIRLQAPDYHPVVESFDLSAALNDPENAPKLHSHDTVRIFSRFDFEPAPWVWVGGDVRIPGKYTTSGRVHLRDALYLAGGPAPDASLESAQVFRTQSDGTMKIFSVNLHEALAGNPESDLLLEPRDRLLLQKNPARVDPAAVEIRGAVARPGKYPLAANMHVSDLMGVAGGFKRSADTQTADLARFSASAPGNPGGNTTLDLGAIANGNAGENLALHPGDVLTIRERPGWADIGASVKVNGEVQHPGTYGIQPGEKLSSLLERSGGLTKFAYPYGAVLTRREVREIENKSQQELVMRLKAEEVNLKALPENDADQKNAKLTAVAQAETALTQLQTNAPIGRVVVHVRPELRQWKGTDADISLRDGDELIIPKKADYVLVNGQVYNPTAVGYRGGRSARWYLSQAGGITPLADKSGVFVIRADGSVISAKNNNSSWFSGDPLSASLQPGDSIVVPEKAPKAGTRNLNLALQIAQITSSLAFAAYYIKP